MPSGVYVRTADHNRKLSEAQKRVWSSPKVRQGRIESIKKGLNTPEIKKKCSEAQKESWSKPEIRQRRIEAMNTPEVKKKHSEAKKKVMNTPEAREKNSESKKKVWSNLEYRKRHIEIMNTQEAKKMMSEAKKKCGYDGFHFEYYRWVRETMFEMLGDICVGCGKDMRVNVPQPHHIDPMTKIFSILNESHRYMPEKVLDEIDKCEMRCVGCHNRVRN